MCNRLLILSASLTPRISLCILWNPISEFIVFGIWCILIKYFLNFPHEDLLIFRRKGKELEDCRTISVIFIDNIKSQIKLRLLFGVGGNCFEIFLYESCKLFCKKPLIIVETVVLVVFTVSDNVGISVTFVLHKNL